MSTQLHSQVIDTVVKYNKIYVPKDYYLSIGSQLIYSSIDTVVYVPIQSDFTLRKSIKSDSVFNSLAQKAQKNTWTKTLHNIILIPPSNTRIQKAESPIEYNNEIYDRIWVRKIIIARHNIFGPSFLDTGQYVYSILERFGNRFHIDTRESIIKEYLQFNVGGEINSFLMLETERILRDASFIQDAKIILKNFSINNDTADVVVLVRDTWSQGADLRIDELNRGSVEIWDNNLLGTGNTNSNFVSWNPESKPSNSLNGFFRTDNIAGSFVNLQIDYSAIGNKNNGLTLWRDFYTSSTKYAGMFKFEQFDGNVRWKSIDNPWYYTQLEYRKIDTWIGRSFQINSDNNYFFSKSNIALSIGLINDRFFKRPNILPRTSYYYHNKLMYLSSVGLSRQGFSKMNLVYSFGRTEDIPYGVLLNLTQAYEYNQFNSRNYYSARLSAGNFVRNIGYVYASIAAGSFVNNNNLEQGILNFKVNSFTNLLVLGQFKTRFFFNIEYTKGFNRYDDEFLTLRDRNGIRGFTSDSVIGDQKLRINVENVLFTPFYLANFRFVFFEFLDLGYVGKPTDWIFKNQLYTGLGVGFRIRNERLVIKTFQFRLAYYPILPYKNNNFMAQIRAESRFDQENFFIRRPEVIGY